jgi:S-adenosylhomocysteine hydrolase
MYRSCLNPLSSTVFGRGVSDRVNYCGRIADDIQLSHKPAIVTALGRATGSIPVSRTSVYAGQWLFLERRWTGVDSTGTTGSRRLYRIARRGTMQNFAAAVDHSNLHVIQDGPGSVDK